MINIHIQSQFIEFVGLDKTELYDLFLSSKDEEDFIDKLNLKECVEQCDFNFKFSSQQEIDETMEEIKEDYLKQAYDCYYLFRNSENMEGYTGIEYSIHGVPYLFDYLLGDKKYDNRIS